MVRFTVISAIAIGGACGALLRYGIGKIAYASGAVTFPLGTMIANFVGCLAIGFFYIWFDQRGNDALREGVRVGLLGALTTFSTFALESIILMEKGKHILAAANVVGSILICLTAAMVGIWIGKATIGV